MALRVAGRIRILRRLVAAVVGLCDPKGSTALEIIEWNERHPYGTSHRQHSHTKGSKMRKDRTRLLAGLRYSVVKGVLEEHWGRYKLAMEGGGRPQGPQRDARPRVSDACRRTCHRSSRRYCTYALSSTSRSRHRQQKRTPARRGTCCSRTSRRRQQPSRRRRPSVRHLQNARSRICKRAARRTSAKQDPKPKGKGKAQGKPQGKGKGKGGCSGGGGTKGGGGCVGCGEGRPDRDADQRRASHLVMLT